MTITEFCDLKQSPAVAYVLGLIFPSCKILEKRNQVIVLGCVSYHSQPNKNPDKCVTVEQITMHWNRVYDFLEATPVLLQSIRHNNDDLFKGAHLKKGFSIYFDINEGLTTADVKHILSNKVQDVLSSNNREIQKFFLRGCFDGRSSVDDKSGLLALDIDLSQNDLDLLNRIADIFGLQRSNNARNVHESRAFQYRIKKESLSTFYNEIGFFSERRRINLDTYLNGGSI